MHRAEKILYSFTLPIKTLKSDGFEVFKFHFKFNSRLIDFFYVTGFPQTDLILSTNLKSHYATKKHMVFTFMGCCHEFNAP